MSTSKQTKVHVVVVGLALALAISTAALGEEAVPSKAPLDPIVVQVVEMLNAGVSDSLILQWLESTGRRPIDIDSQGLIALTEADASERLMTALLELVDQGRPADSESTPSAARAASPLEWKPLGSPQAMPTAVPGDGAEAIIQLTAKRVWVDEEEPDSPREPPWSAFLYLDGHLVAWVRPGANAETVEARRVIQSGRRELRVVLQRYEERRSGWRLESLVVPHLVEFDAAAGDPVEIEVDLKRIWGLWRDRKAGGPLSYLIRQGDVVLSESDGTGGNPDRWQPICEDVEANFPESEGVPRAYRSSMSRCVRWADLWNGPGQETSREKILEILAEHDFEPPVR